MPLQFETWPAHSRDFSRELAGLCFRNQVPVRLFARPIFFYITGKLSARPCSQARVFLRPDINGSKCYRELVG